MNNIPTNPIAAIVLITIAAIKVIGSLDGSSQDGDSSNNS